MIILINGYTKVFMTHLQALATLNKSVIYPDFKNY